MEQEQTNPEPNSGHAELERFHYEALKNPLYLAEGLADVLREDLMMNMPIPRPEPPLEQVIIHRHSTLDRKEYDLLQQTARETKHLREMLKGHLQPKKKDDSPF